ncbi:MAG TPA: hypothetical protein DD000_12515, partial [Cyanobacteria bacterium UBA11166]|nr:hypothetical protein [Cyanobacteria bacterium UBA11166]
WQKTINIWVLLNKSFGEVGVWGVGCGVWGVGCGDIQIKCVAAYKDTQEEKEEFCPHLQPLSLKKK